MSMWRLLGFIQRLKCLMVSRMPSCTTKNSGEQRLEARAAAVVAVDRGDEFVAVLLRSRPGPRSATRAHGWGSGRPGGRHAAAPALLELGGDEHLRDVAEVHVGSPEEWARRTARRRERAVILAPIGRRCASRANPTKPEGRPGAPQCGDGSGSIPDRPRHRWQPPWHRRRRLLCAAARLRRGGVTTPATRTRRRVRRGRGARARPARDRGGRRRGAGGRGAAPLSRRRRRISDRSPRSSTTPVSSTSPRGRRDEHRAPEAHVRHQRDRLDALRARGGAAHEHRATAAGAARSSTFRRRRPGWRARPVRRPRCGQG